MGRTPCCITDGLKKGAWTTDEDRKLIAYIQKHGEGSWRSLPEKAGLQRCGKSCRLRWTNYLRPGIKRGQFSSEEGQTIIALHATLGNKWAAIARHLPKRTDNEIKNYWNAHLKKRLFNMSIDPVTHKPIATSTTSSAYTGDSNAANPCMLDDDHQPTDSARHGESEATPQKRSSSNSVSASASLLNKLASKITALRCTDSLIACIATEAVANDMATSRFSSNALLQPATDSHLSSMPTETVATTLAVESNNVADHFDSDGSFLALPSIVNSNSLENASEISSWSSLSSSSTTTSAGVLNNMDARFHEVLQYWQSSVEGGDDSIVDIDVSVVDIGSIGDCDHMGSLFPLMSNLNFSEDPLIDVDEPPDDYLTTEESFLE